MGTSSARLPLRFRLAQLVRALPDYPGRDTTLEVLMSPDAGYPDAPVRGSFGGGLLFEGNPASDRNILELPLLRFARPALARVLETVLAPGGVFADVGANVGLYSLWAARIVGPSGVVHAFEPVPQTAAVVRRNAEINGFRQVEVAELGLGAEPGRVRLRLMDRASGRTSRYGEWEGEAVEVPVTTLDAWFAERRRPDLVKIDVEGMEGEVLAGAVDLLGGEDPPVVVFEAQADLLAAAGTSYPEVLALLATHGFGVWALGRRGVRREPAEAPVPGSMNVLAARPGHPRHDAVLDRLARTRFPSNQNA